MDGDAQVELQTGLESLTQFADRLKQEHLSAIKSGKASVFRPKVALRGAITIAYKGKSEHYVSYCQTHHVCNFGKVRLVMAPRRATFNYRRPDLTDSPVFFITNRLVWQAAGITRIRRHRKWPFEGPWPNATKN